MPSDSGGNRERFEAIVAPHLDDAFTLARYLTHDADAAQDIVQESCLRALRFIGGYRGGDGRAWFLAIVRSRCAEWFRTQGRLGLMVEYDDAMHSPETETATSDSGSLHEAVDNLPPVFREVVVLRELCQLPYREIAEVTGVPVGTVMSRLSRARDRLRVVLGQSGGEDA